jgi:hypothetical protein
LRHGAFSAPFTLRCRLANVSSLLREIQQIFVRAIFASIYRPAGIPALDRRDRCGAVSFARGIGDTLRLNAHSHNLALPGVSIVNEKGKVVFRQSALPSDAATAHGADRILQSVAGFLGRRYLEPAAIPEEAASLQRGQPLPV